MSGLHMPSDLKDELLAAGRAACDSDLHGQFPYLQYYWTDSRIIDGYNPDSPYHQETYVYIARLHWRRQSRRAFVEERTQ